MQDKKLIFAVECKTGEKQISSHINYFAERTNIPTFYQVHMGTKTYEKGKVTVLPFSEFCRKLELP